MGTYHILIVDDSATFRAIIRRLLAPLRAEIEEAVNGQEGLKRAASERFDLIITDVDMPYMDGLELCDHLKRNPSTRDIPVAMVSTFDKDIEIERGFQAGASVYVSKHDLQEQLLPKIEALLFKSSFQRQRNVLVVDDSPPIRLAVENGLAQAGFQVLTAECGRKALQLVRQKCPDLILTDLKMPDMDGLMLCERLQADSQSNSIPLVVMSTTDDHAKMKRAVQQGAVAFLTKPFNVDQLVILVEKLLSDRYLLLLEEKKKLDTERKLLLASITSLTDALEARDPYTRGHSESVARILCGMLSLAGADAEEIERADIGARLHDIGKIGVRDSVLLKAGPLTKAEYDEIKKHPTIGANILKSIPSLSDVIPIVLFHHERIDGKGYPSGLKGSDIPQLARMTAVADVFDALTSDRPYRKGMPVEKVLQILEDSRGTQLCPDSLDLLLKWSALQEKMEVV